MKKKERSYGTWPAVDSFQKITDNTEQPLFPQIYQGILYWMQRRKNGEMSVASTINKDLLPEGMRAQTKVHEYGGISYLVCKKGMVFSSADDQMLYLVENSGVKKLTQTACARYADGVYHEQEDAFYYVRETHEKTGVKNVIVCLKNGEEKVILSGEDFYSNPRISKDGKTFLCLSWSLGFMPWQNAKLHIYARCEQGTLVEKQRIADPNYAVAQPSFCPKGVIHFLMDRSGYMNLYKYENGSIQPLSAENVEVGMPSWVFGVQAYGFWEKENGCCIVGSFFVKGEAYLGELCSKTKKWLRYAFPFMHYSFLAVEKDSFYSVVEGKNHLSTLIRIDSAKTFSYVNHPPKTYPLSQVSCGKPIVFPTKDANSGYGFLYLPKHSAYVGEKNQKMPLIVKVHGGPTALHTNAFSLETQFWTSRGFAYFAINYRGSTGFGKKYRDALNEKWGKLDVQDCIDAVEYLLQAYSIDANKVAIRGSSAGGHTALFAATKTCFQAVVSYYGICDVEKMIEKTHKFEKGYNDTLIGPYPEKQDLYKQRCILDQINKVHIPVLLFHGGKDVVVPVEQSQEFYNALQKANKESDLHIFPDEGHGFRKLVNKQTAWEIELRFYQKIFGYKISTSKGIFSS